MAAAGFVAADTPAAATPAPAPAADLATRAATIAVDFGTRLKTELQAALQQGGPVAAIAVCHERAPAIAMALGETSGWEVRRTSLRVRNPDNAPDAWERGVLESFEERVAAGESPAALEQQATITIGEHHYFRYMKAIPTGDVCTACHGAVIAPDVQARLGELYPDDRATGFRPGDLRGAFSLTRKID